MGAITMLWQDLLVWNNSLVLNVSVSHFLDLLSPPQDAAIVTRMTWKHFLLLLTGSLLLNLHLSHHCILGVGRSNSLSFNHPKIYTPNKPTGWKLKSFREQGKIICRWSFFLQVSSSMLSFPVAFFAARTISRYRFILRKSVGNKKKMPYLLSLPF